MSNVSFPYHVAISSHPAQTSPERTLLKDDRLVYKGQLHQDGCTQERVSVPRFHSFSIPCSRTSFDESLVATTVRIAPS